MEGLGSKILAEYKIVVENFTPSGDERDAVTMWSVYTKEGKYVGTLEDMKCYKDKGILPETYDNNNICSIGKSIKDGKWYGWSHRARYGFKIGDTVKEGDCCATSGWTDEYLKEHPDDKPLPVGFEAKTEEDCKRMAIAFAGSVS